MTVGQVGVALIIVLLMWGVFALLDWPLISLPGFIAVFAVFAAVSAVGTSVFALAAAALGMIIVLLVIGFAMRYEPRLPGMDRSDPGGEKAEREPPE